MKELGWDGQVQCILLPQNKGCMLCKHIQMRFFPTLCWGGNNGQVDAVKRNKLRETYRWKKISKLRLMEYTVDD